MFEQAQAMVSWSGGKDSALALHYMLNQDIEVKCLATTFNATRNRVAMHGVSAALLLEQAKQLNLPLIEISMPEMPDMQTYERIMNACFDKLKAAGITHAIYGDIFLEDLKHYRENQLRSHDIKAIFPLWKKNSRTLIYEFLELGYKTIVVCAQDNLREFCGRIIDYDFLKDLPDEIDPCGENGEFHTFVFDGPIFRKPVAFKIGECSHQKFANPNGNFTDLGFWFIDLLP